ncbi:MAG: Vms1/Ankzf1 family peptidyl-tRNA hydrolase [Acidimicrobiales bacterium]
MERTTANPDVAATPVADLGDLLSGQRPSATVYLDTRADQDNAAQRAALSWKELRGQMAGQGCPEAVLAAVDPLVRDAHLRGACLAVVAGEEGVSYLDHGPDPVRRDVGRWDSLPSVTPVVEWRQMSPPHLMVVTDRSGADLVAVGWDGVEDKESAGGEDGPLSKSAPGGWSQPRYQQRAQNTWEHNARDVAHEVTRLAERVAARVIVVAGDVRALSLLRDDLDRETAALLSVAGGGRSEDNMEGLAVEVVKMVADAVARDTVTVLEAWRAGLGRPLHGPSGTPATGRLAVDGPEATLGALRAGQVATLLVHDDPDDDRRAWYGPEVGHAALTATELADLGVDDPTEARLVDVALRSALGTGARVRVVPRAGGPAGGLGALLRWPEPG